MKKTLIAVALVALALPALARAQEAPVAPAPAAAEPQIDLMQFADPYSAANRDSLAKPNHTSDEVIAWTGKTVSDVVSFKASDFRGQIKAVQKNFVESGWAEYAAWMKGMKFLEAAQGGKYVLATITENTPIILDSGLNGEAWQWTVSVPIVTSITRAGDDPETATPISTRKSRIKMTLLRVKDGADGVAVGGWQMVE